MYRTTIVLALLFSVFLASATLRGDNWPEFRGPTADGHGVARKLPVTWSETQYIRWKTAIHDKGWSSPVIWDNQVWMTTAREDGKELFGVCLDRDTGKIVFDLKVFEVAKPAFCIAFNSYASSTPVIEAGRVYLHFGSAGTACVNTATGKVLWTRNDLPCDHWRGPGSSPILYENLLILTFDGYDLQYLAALDKTTGKTVWKKDRDIDYHTDNGDLKKAYSTPTLITVGGKPQLICPSATATIAYQPATGEELWRVEHGGMNVSSRPLFGGGRLYLTSGHTAKLLAVRPDGRGNVTDSHIDWTFNKGVPTRPSLLLIEERLYMVSDKGIASCVDARTGQLLGQVRLGDNFSASPLYAAGHIYFANETGRVYVVEPTPALKVVSINPLDEGCMASPAVAGEAIFLRTRTHLYRIEEK
jgi:outer membrane protein assembly factor BamB